MNVVSKTTCPSEFVVLKTTRLAVYVTDTDENLVSSRFSREMEVSVSVSISNKGYPESQSQSRSRVSNLAMTGDTFPNLLLSKNLEKFEISRRFESLSLDLDLV